MELLNVLNVFFFFLTTVCVKLLGLYLPVYMFCGMRASVSGLMALLVLWFFPLNIFIHSFIDSPYSITVRRVPELIAVLGSQLIMWKLLSGISVVLGHSV